MYVKMTLGAHLAVDFFIWLEQRCGFGR